MATKKEAVVAPVVSKYVKVERNLQSIDYRKCENQPIATLDGVVIGVFKTKDNRRGLSITDVKTGKLIVLAGEGKLNEKGEKPFYALTEVGFLQWKKEATIVNRVAVAVKTRAQ
jgi:hypothetical protein